MSLSPETKSGGFRQFALMLQLCVAVRRYDAQMAHAGEVLVAASALARELESVGPGIEAALRGFADEAGLPFPERKE